MNPYSEDELIEQPAINLLEADGMGDAKLLQRIRAGGRESTWQANQIRSHPNLSA